VTMGPDFTVPLKENVPTVDPVEVSMHDSLSFNTMAV
jgi:hypothetical protein